MNKWATGKRQIIAHKGNSAVFPENTRASVLSAIEVGCDVVEVDVSTTKDGYSVALHGPTLGEMTSGVGKISEANWEDIKPLKVKISAEDFSTESVPLVEELLKEFSSSTKWNLDLKSGLPSDKLVATINTLSIQGKVIFSGLTVKDVKKFVKVFPELNVLVNLSRVDRVLLGLRLFDKIYFQFRFGFLKSHPNVIGVNTNYRFLTERIIKVIHGFDLEVWVFTVDEEVVMNSLLAINVNSITTNRPLELIRAFESE